MENTLLILLDQTWFPEPVSFENDVENAIYFFKSIWILVFFTLIMLIIFIIALVHVFKSSGLLEAVQTMVIKKAIALTFLVVSTGGYGYAIVNEYEYTLLIVLTATAFLNAGAALYYIFKAEPLITLFKH